jgi:hypothetical protein
MHIPGLTYNVRKVYTGFIQQDVVESRRGLKKNNKMFRKSIITLILLLYIYTIIIKSILERDLYNSLRLTRGQLSYVIDVSTVFDSPNRYCQQITSYHRSTMYRLVRILCEYGRLKNWFKKKNIIASNSLIQQKLEKYT